MGEDKDVVLDGLDAPEGPEVTADGTVFFVQQRRGAVSRVEEDHFVDVSLGSGSPNSVVFGNDGHLYATQNGGVVGAWRSPMPCTPSIQRITMRGEVTSLVEIVEGAEMRAPNDLVFGPDRKLYVTDPSEGYAPGFGSATNRIYSIAVDDPSEAKVVVELPPVYVNGIAFLTDGRLCWAESYPRTMCVLEDGERRVLVELPENHVPDGMAVAADGRVYVATVGSHGITVISPEGDVIDHILLDERAIPTNCAFSGSNLWVTDFGVRHDESRTAGRLWCLETDAVGAS